MLSHRLPYPPHKGEKLRAWQWLLRLSQQHRVHLGCFVDDETDWAGVPAVRAHCEALWVGRISPRWKRLSSLKALLRGGSLTERYFFEPALAAWVAKVVKDAQIQDALVYCSAMGQYLLPHPGLRCAMDFVDVDSQKWADYAASRPLLSPLYRRESRTLQKLELASARRAQKVFFVTEAERQCFARLSGMEERLAVVENGVDTAFFSPEKKSTSPYQAGEQAVVFTGVMDYWPNVDAVCWFAREVWPQIALRFPAARFYVVGMRPAKAVRALANDRCVVTGRVPDVRPYLAHAAVAVAPLRIARGVQNKVLEAMSMACPVVASGAGGQAIRATPGEAILVAEAASDFAAAVAQCLSDRAFGQQLGRAARARVQSDYHWDTQWQRMARAMDWEA
jgi:sugar transferase (PEP-CTERM/EpsH1 system associated)